MAKPKRRAPTIRTIDYVVAALAALGGASRAVDIEDVAMEAHRLAPHRFSWRNYPEQVDIAGVRDGLSDARKKENGELVVGDRKHGWTLTEAGVALANVVGPSLLQRGSVAVDERERVDVPVRAAERQRVMMSRALAKAQAGHLGNVSPQEIRELFRIDRYVTEEKYKQRVALVRNSLAEDPGVLEVVDRLEQRYREMRGH